MAKYVALFRGINVGTAKSVPMARLAEIFAELGYTEVTTVLRSGNVVFRAEGVATSAAAAIESAVLDDIGVRSSVQIVDSTQFSAIVAANPLVDVATDGSRSFVTFTATLPTTLDLPDAASIAPELLAVGPAAVYQWMPHGSQQTKVPKSFWKQFPTPLTARNWNTVSKLQGLLEE